MSKIPESLSNIQKVYPSLRSAERRIADCILTRADEVIYFSVTELAEEAHSSESSVVRLAQRAGYKGYQALKIAIARDIVGSSSASVLYEAITPADKLPVVMQKVFAFNMLALSSTLESIEPVELEKAVEAISKARKVELYGLGASASVASDAQHKFLKIGIPVTAVLDSNLQVMSASLLEAGDVAMGISHSGTLKDTIEALQIAEEAGATTICLTNNRKSPLAKLSQICLITAAQGTAFQSEIMASRLAQLSVIDTLYVAVALQRYEEVQENLRKTSEATISRRY
jgi:RpiR family transcriptional regulator, carbohydrate utilization regulator